MEKELLWLWQDLIEFVSDRTLDITHKLMHTGILSDVKNDNRKALRDTCDDLLGIISRLYGRVLVIKTQSFGVEKPKNNMEE